jgi:transposase-like protein
MSTLTREQMRDLIRGNNFKSVSDISTHLKDIFKDLIQEMLEAEIETELGYAKNNGKNTATENSRNVYNHKTIKSEFGEIPIQVPRDRNDEFEPKIIQKYQRKGCAVSVLQIPR